MLEAAIFPPFKFLAWLLVKWWQSGSPRRGEPKATIAAFGQNGLEVWALPRGLVCWGMPNGVMERSRGFFCLAP